MKERPPSDARAAALDALMRGGDSAADLDRVLATAHLRPNDRAFATELAYGTLKMRRALTWSVGRFLNRPFERLEPRLQWILLIGAYQLLYLARVPAHSAVDESVRLASAGGHRGIAGLANAVLRRVATERPVPPKPVDGSDPAALALYASLPDWIARHLIDRFGFTTALEAAQGMNASPRRAIRIDGDAERRSAVLAELAAAGVATHASTLGIPECAVIDAGSDIAPVRALVASGVAAWESEQSQLAVDLLGPVPGERILDACCGRGVKTLMIAGRMGGDGEIWSIDDDAAKLARLNAAAARAGGAPIIHTVAADARLPYPASMPAAFDAALIDAPCSGLGIIGRRADARWRKHPNDPERFSAVQRAVLARAADAVRAGGRLLYVTCSTHPAENERVVDAFLAERPQWRPRPAREATAHLRRIGPYLMTVPGIDGADGFFYASLERMPA